ncbi:MAG: DNA-3-methyladenine glycosylase [Caldilineales bacterium]|nr:DNA-3-methyladenine glycosylase [Caldilineales bacterium]MDW8318951.1 DNA-3-methyladenine glycosylase [Anaerolineae bacterium]
MQVMVRIGEPLWRTVGARRLPLEFAQDTVTVADVLSRLAATYPGFEAAYRAGAWGRGVPYHLFVNARAVARGQEDQWLLRDGDQVYLMVPAVGGQPRPGTVLPRSFYLQPTLEVARNLLGCRLVRHWRGQRLSGVIVEAEAYIGQGDLASHAARGRTPRNRAMFGPGGLAYVYLIYGMHHCLNVVTEQEGFPAAVLIRSIVPLEGVEVMQSRRPGHSLLRLADGPGKVCQVLAIDRRLDGHDLTVGEALWVEAGSPVPDEAVLRTPRINVGGDERARTLPWRLVVSKEWWEYVTSKT